MTQLSHPIIKVSELFQVGIVVPNLENSIRDYESILGIGSWKIMDAKPPFISDTTYHGRPVKHSFRAAITMVGPMQLELLQPVEGECIYRDFLKEHGPGIHHLGHVKVDNLDETVQILEKDGFRCLQSGRHGGWGWAYIDMVKSLGYVIELTSGSVKS